MTAKTPKHVITALYKEPPRAILNKSVKNGLVQLNLTGGGCLRWSKSRLEGKLRYENKLFRLAFFV